VSEEKIDWAAIRKPKNKRVAVILAVALGPLTWLYTWGRDWWKFTIAVSIPIVLLVTVPVVMVYHLNRNVHDHLLDALVIYFAIPFVFIGTHALAIIEGSFTPSHWYQDYPTVKMRLPVAEGSRKARRILLWGGSVALLAAYVYTAVFFSAFAAEFLANWSPREHETSSQPASSP